MSSTNTTATSAQPFTSLVDIGRVHADIYTSSDVFDREMDKIFGHTWVYIGHETEIPQKGDYRLRKIGRQPVIFVRGADGEIRVLMNRCRHRGAAICEVERGNVGHFRCWYHGWTYENTGRNVDIPDPGAYGPTFDQSSFDLTAAPRVDSYRGLVFACLDRDAVSLREHLGLAMAYIDFAIDISPTGKIFVDSGEHRFEYKGNWKLVGMDGYHVNYVHQSVMTNRARKVKQITGKAYVNPYNDESNGRTRDLRGGHSMLDFVDYRREEADFHLDEWRRIPNGDVFIDSMIAAYGEERGKLLVVMSGDPHLAIFPNLQLIGTQIRIITPLAADRTEVVLFPTRLDGVPDNINVHRLRRHESFFSPAGSGTPDDSEIFERVHRGLAAQVNPWIDISRGLHRERVDADGSIVGTMTDEVPQRAQLRRWVELMGAQ